MTPEFKAAWVAALRSGKYQQGKNALRHGDKFCCLGVACDLIDAGAWEKDDGAFGIGWNGYESTDLPFIDSYEAIRLARLNDEGYRFDLIAYYIEAHVI